MSFSQDISLGFGGFPENRVNPIKGVVLPDIYIYVHLQYNMYFNGFFMCGQTIIFFSMKVEEGRWGE